jgi:hypothetical protein
MIAIQLDAWHIVSFVAMLVTAFFALVKVIVWQFKADLNTRFKVTAERFDATEIRLDKIENMQRTHEREFLNLKAELPEKYVRREDAIRSETLVNAKLDGLALRLDTVLRNQNNE